MANSSVKITDTNKRVVYQWTGDSTDARILKIDAGTLNYSLNANNKLLGSGTDRRTKYRLSLKNISYSVQGGSTFGYVQITTDGDATPSNTVMNLSGAGYMNFNEHSEPFNIDLFNQANTTGNIYLQPIGFTGNCSYTIVADFRKHAQDYDQGQTAAPIDFNRGSALSVI